jgi:two-component system, cell cycle sensor histidine kinase and response regulator CckA
MTGRHSLLKRQLKRCFGDSITIPEPWQAFVDAVNEAYLASDRDRQMLERALELSSQELLQANSEMRAVFLALPDLLFRIDHQGTILSFKAGSVSDLVLDPKQFSGKRIQDIPVKPVGDLFHGAIARVLEEKTVVSVEYSLTPPGQSVPCAYEARFAPLLEKEIIVIIRNITERKQAEDQLRAAHQRLLDIIDFLPDATFVIDQEKKVIAWNRAIEEMTGTRKEEVVGRGDYAYAVPFYGQPRPILVDLIGAEHPEFGSEYKYVRKQGHSLYAEVFVPSLFGGAGAHVWVTASPLLDRQGHQVGAIESVRDITQRKQLEEQFRQVQKMEAFGQLAAGIAHDFNNLLTIIQGNLNLLQMERLSETEQASAMHEAELASERASNLTRQLLTFSHRRPMQARNLDLNEVAAGTTKMLQRLIGEHITLEARYAAGGAPVHADPGMLEQVLVNLAVNSRDAMPKGGRLTIETQTVVFNETNCPPNENALPGEYVRLSVTDTGTGIPREHLPHIFEPFFTTKDVGQGTGLGLATVFGIMDQHHGWVEVESQVNIGTTFQMYLPCLAGEAALSEETSLSPEPRRGTETILLVEDEDSLRHLLLKALERYGYRVFEAASGVAALSVWREHASAIDLLVTDMVMPGGVGGRELADQLRSEKPGLRVIYCSGYTDAMLGEDSLLRSNVDFLEKPFASRKFLRHVRECLDAR